MSENKFAAKCLLLITALALLLIASCISLGPTPTPTPTKTPKPSRTAGAAQAVMFVAPPTETPTPTPLSSPTPTPTPTNICPLTGQPVDDLKVLERRPIAVKISNIPDVRPQSGLAFADIVYEHLTEGGITRFTAIFLCHDAERIGSIRSARLIDLEIPIFYGAFFVYSGACPEVTRMLDNSDFAEYTLSEWRGDPGFYRIKEPGRAYEHTLFTDTELLWSIAEERGWNERQEINNMAFSEEPPPGGSPARTIFIPYHRKYSDVRYEYDEDKEAYLRFVTGEPHKDALTGEQLAVRNVVIVYVNHVETLIVEDALGSRSVQIQLWGEGRALVCRDGRVYEARWVRPNRPDPLRIVDAEGNLFPFKPGNTWFQLVPLDMEVEVK